MNQFDREIREAAARDNFQVPEQVHARMEQVLDSLPERLSHPRRRTWVRVVNSLAACLVLVLLVLLPNVSVAYAEAMENIPVLGKLVQVFTIRSYMYDDSHYTVDAQIPAVKDSQNPQAESLINQDVDQLTQTVLHQFYREMNIGQNKGYGSIYIDYETVSNTPEWFTLKLCVSQISASSSNYSKFYHIDRTNGKYVTFGDMFDEEGRRAIGEMVREQMEERMAGNPSETYISKMMSENEELVLEPDQNFYFNIYGDLVVSYDKYAVAPGSMGNPEFTIPYDSIVPYVRYSLKGK